MDDLLETMYAAPGIGLAAPQVGQLRRVIVLDIDRVLDVSTEAALKQALLAAKSFARSEGPSGVYIEALLGRMGIADAMKAKTVVVRGRLVGDALVKGEAEIGVQQISELKSVPGVHVLPMPAEIQHVTVFSAGLSATSKDSEAVKALIKFLTSPAAAPVIKAKGLEPA